jgi:8-oxo-dGTP diphosphatase
MKHIQVVAAIVVHNHKILCVQRNENKYAYISKKYEFPGGKMEEGESREETIKREMFEELKMAIEVKEDFLTVTHEYPDFKITMHSFVCSCMNTSLELSEHIDFQWLHASEIGALDWAAADIPIVNKLMANG